MAKRHLTHRAYGWEGREEVRKGESRRDGEAGRGGSRVGKRKEREGREGGGREGIGRK